jgi:hypothetical protein
VEGGWGGVIYIYVEREREWGGERGRIKGWVVGWVFEAMVDGE